MVYNYPQLQWRLDSVLLGSGDADGAAHHVPVGALLLRDLPHDRRSSCCGARGRRGCFVERWLWPLVVLAAAYGFAWAETYAMAGGAIAEQFTYRDLPRMLRWGSLFYACLLRRELPDDLPARRGARRRLAATPRLPSRRSPPGCCCCSARHGSPLRRPAVLTTWRATSKHRSGVWMFGPCRRGTSKHRGGVWMFAARQLAAHGIELRR